ncbi:hypothetical protein DCC61_03185 [Candidatus Microgenomates bacterium]|nr:hypothetical protein [Candidatus Microgenomates bacterium CPR3]RIK51258.1 MAG: hypothetical protein DCC61_03185 [Candidatus Microgenomates bacterium]
MIQDTKYKLLLVDGSALLHRAYHAYPPLTSKSGQVVGAVYGVASMLYSALVEVNPSHVMVAWDLPKPTFRHEKYVGYKAQRPKADQEMVEQIPIVKSVIEAMGILQSEVEGYEADDIIGTLSRIEIDGEVVILTGDQDTMQLVGEHVSILTPPKGKLPAKMYGVDEVREKYGVTPGQIVDYKALIGDVSDNIPGIAGVGPKTASTLLSRFKTLEQIYDHIEEMDDNLKQKLISGKDSAFLSQDLSRIVTDMPLSIQLADMEYVDIKKDLLKTNLEELGFKSLIRRIWGDEERTTKSKIPDNQMGLF